MFRNSVCVDRPYPVTAFAIDDRVDVKNDDNCSTWRLILRKMVLLGCVMFCGPALWCADQSGGFYASAVESVYDAYPEFIFDPLMIVNGSSSLLMGSEYTTPSLSPDYYDGTPDAFHLSHGAPEGSQRVEDVPGEGTRDAVEHLASFAHNDDAEYCEVVEQLSSIAEGGGDDHGSAFSDEEDRGDTQVLPEKTSKHLTDLYDYLCTEKEVRFSDVRKSIYGNSCVNVFQADLLRLMQRGEDIREVQEGLYRHFGKVSAEEPKPKDSVAVAMFKILCGPPKILFYVKFQLYIGGYRGYSQEFFTILEGALAIGDVHPGVRQLRTKGEVSVNIALKTHWNTIRCLTKPEMRRYLIKAGKEDVIDKRTHRQMLRCLWDLQEAGDFEKLCDLYAETEPRDQSTLADHDDGDAFMKGNRKFPVLSALRNRKNQPLFIDDLLDLVGWSKSINHLVALEQTVLVLAVEGWPIIYNKDAYSVTFTDPPQPVAQPSKDTNFLTMLYDLIQKYAKKLSQEEVVYYAYRGGYWSPEGGEEMKKDFYERINAYTEFLAIQKYIDVSYCARTNRSVVSRRRFIWEVVMAEGGVYDDPAHYKGCGDVTQEDLAAIKRIVTLRTEEEFRVFYRHQQTLRRTSITPLAKVDIIKGHAIVRPLSKIVFVRLCRNIGAKSEQEAWNIAGILTKRTHGGRLLYNPKNMIFFWDSTGRCPELTAAEYVAEIFLLKHRYPKMTHQTFSYMLIQTGVPEMNGHSVFRVLRGLEMLGLYCTKKGPCVKERKTLNDLLLKKKGVRGNVQSRAVASWVCDGAMENLWKAYLIVQKEQDFRDEDECAPNAKRQKFDEPDRPENIISRYIPALKDFLIKKGFSL